jgi:lysophospholipase L1-like esterase
VKTLRKILFIALPAAVMAAALMVLAIEGWVRAAWDEKRGTIGFLVSHPTRGQRLGYNYDGWFAGVPVRTNALGFRSDRQDQLAKSPNTFRILVLGDSVTFGHGAVHDYPSLFEQTLKAWRPDVDWQVWNLGVPGYNTSQELAYLNEVGQAYQPDLVVVGFYINDIVDNRTRTPSAVRTAASRSLALLQTHWYSTEYYKRVVLTLAWRFSGSESYRLRFEALESEERMAAQLSEVEAARQQAITPWDRYSEEEVAGRQCPGGMKAGANDLAEMQAQPDWPAFVDAVRGFQALERDGRYPLVFFLNLVPPVCRVADYFYDAKADENEFFIKLFSATGTPTFSVYPHFLRVRPSQMPLAEGHAIGNANQLKADVLFSSLRERLAAELPPVAVKVR